jgi:ABC-type nitrate/sulfonate/bicarbonate transport system substrate-binding protein
LAAKYELDIQVKLVAGEAEGAEKKLLGGEVDLLMGQHFTPFVTRVTGANLSWIAVAQNYRDYKLVTLPHIQSPEELKGKRIAVSRNPCLGINQRLILDRMGLEREVTIVTTQRRDEYQDMVDLLEKGEVEATFVDTPIDVVARRLGLRVVETTPRLDIIAGECLTTYPRVIRERDEALRRLMKAYLHTVSLIKRNKGIMREAVMTENRVKEDLKNLFDVDDARLVEAFVDHWTSRWEKKPYATLSALKNSHEKAIRYDAQVRDVNPVSLLDMRYVKELDEGGFIDSLYQ